MGPATKEEALAKLATFRPKIGYPERWIDYGKLDKANEQMSALKLEVDKFLKMVRAA